MYFKLFIKNIILFFIFCCFGFDNYCFAAHPKIKDEGCFSNPFKKITRKFRELFVGCCQQSSGNLYQAIDQFVDLELGEKNIGDSSLLGALPPEVLFSIAYFFDPSKHN